MIGILLNKWTWLAIFFVAALVTFKVLTVKLEDALIEAAAQRDRAVASETLREECNTDIRQKNAEIAIHAAISEVEQIDREKLTEERDVYRRSSISRTEKVRTANRMDLRAMDCGASNLSFDHVASLLNNAAATASQRTAN